MEIALLPGRKINRSRLIIESDIKEKAGEFRDRNMSQ